MSPPTFTGREVATVLIDMGCMPVHLTGSHFQLRYEHPETAEFRNVTVPLHGKSKPTPFGPTETCIPRLRKAKSINMYKTIVL